MLSHWEQKLGDIGHESHRNRCPLLLWTLGTTKKGRCPNPSLLSPRTAPCSRPLGFDGDDPMGNSISPGVDTTDTPYQQPEQIHIALGGPGLATFDPVVRILGWFLNAPKQSEAGKPLKHHSGSCLRPHCLYVPNVDDWYVLYLECEFKLVEIAVWAWSFGAVCHTEGFLR